MHAAPAPAPAPAVTVTPFPAAAAVRCDFSSRRHRELPGKNHHRPPSAAAASAGVAATGVAPVRGDPAFVADDENCGWPNRRAHHDQAAPGASVPSTRAGAAAAPQTAGVW